MTYLELESVKGHDSFLLELEELESLLKPFLNSISSEVMTLASTRSGGSHR